VAIPIKFSSGLRLKIIFLSVLPSLFIVVVISWFSNRGLIEISNEASLQQASPLAAVVNSTIHTKEDLDPILLDSLLVRLQQFYPNINHLAIYVLDHNQSKRIGSSRREEIMATVGVDKVAPILTGKSVFREDRQNNLIEILEPILLNDQPVASVGIYLPTAPRDRLLFKETSWLLTTAALGFFVLAFILYFFLNRLIVRPVSHIKEVADQIAQGDPKVKVQLVRTDEIGVLANAINTMSDSLRSRSSLLSATLESTADGILVVDLEGKILSFNRKFLAMWRASDPIIRMNDQEQASAFATDQLKDPESFFKTVEELRVQPHAESYDIIEFKDGRFFERYSQPQRIDGACVGRVWSFRDITQQKRAEEKLNYLANFDSLTALPNRTLFYDRLEQAIRRAPWHKRSVAVMFLDLDRFKNINDTLGHPLGDLLLKAVAECLTHCVREGDTVARLGGDEFVLILDDLAQPRDTLRIAQKILRTLSNSYNLKGQEVFITASIGIAVYPNDGKDCETLLKNADAAMYRAKDQGRNNCQLYSPALNAKISERMELENSLRHALERGEILVHYQPIVDVATGQINRMEALVRWKRPDIGIVSPVKFIPLAEETGLIVPIGEWILRTACAQNKAWQSAGLPPIRMAVNLSASQFQQQNLAEMIANTLDEVDLDPKYLELELTESIIMKNTETTLATLLQLDALGIDISVDDFGTGYSSLSYLKRFPVTTLKIDGSFIRDITTDPDDRAIVTAIITLASSLKLKVVAESVETDQQLQILRSLHCDQMQGYLFSKPLPVEEATQLLAQKNDACGNLLKSDA